MARNVNLTNEMGLSGVLRGPAMPSNQQAGVDALMGRLRRAQEAEQAGPTQYQGVNPYERSVGSVSISQDQISIGLPADVRVPGLEIPDNEVEVEGLEIPANEVEVEGLDVELGPEEAPAMGDIPSDPIAEGPAPSPEPEMGAEQAMTGQQGDDPMRKMLLDALMQRRAMSEARRG
jgi:hypothetical protein